MTEMSTNNLIHKSLVLPSLDATCSSSAQGLVWFKNQRPSIFWQAERWMECFHYNALFIHTHIMSPKMSTADYPSSVAAAVSVSIRWTCPAPTPHSQPNCVSQSTYTSHCQCKLPGWLVGRKLPKSAPTPIHDGFTYHGILVSYIGVLGNVYA